MKQADREFLNSQAKLIFESDLRFAQVLASLEMAYKAGLEAAKN